MPQRRAQSLTKWVVLAAVVAAVAVVAAAAVRFARPAVTVTELVEGPAVQAFYATGTLEPADREHPIRAPADGFVHGPAEAGTAKARTADAGAAGGKPAGVAAYVDKGDRVAKGQVLAVIYNEQFQQAYDRSAADAVEKRARAHEQTSPVLQEMDAKIAAYGELVGAATREFKRYGAGIEAGAANQSDYDRALDRLKTLVSDFESFKAQKLQAKLKLDRELAEAESALKTATWNLEQTKVVSPIDGFVLDKPQQLGTKVAVNDLIVTVADTSPGNLVMRAQVDEEDVTKVFPPDGGDESATPAAPGPAAAAPQQTSPAATGPGV
ncbi:MAG: efflux transporter, family, subunit, partial [Phycisphaerales bacterium]|nr:efflux transporter, family, subunit [Phycisphaerales bacterium]